MSKTAEKFWKSRKEYPPVIYNFQRRYLDLGIILRYIEGVNSVLDLGCGEGQNSLLLRELTDIKNYHAYDMSKVFIKNLINRWGKYPELEAKIVNFTKTSDLPETDMCICMGVMLYILDDNDLKYMMSNIKSKIFICRVPCNLKSERLEIDKFSEEYGENYAAVYRTIPEYMSILSEFFIIESIDRCYPNEIESDYGSKQFYFICKNGEK